MRGSFTAHIFLKFYGKKYLIWRPQNQIIYTSKIRRILKISDKIKCWKNCFLTISLTQTANLIFHTQINCIKTAIKLLDHCQIRSAGNKIGLFIHTHYLFYYTLIYIPYLSLLEAFKNKVKKKYKNEKSVKDIRWKMMVGMKKFSILCKILQWYRMKFFSSIQHKS